MKTQKEWRDILDKLYLKANAHIMPTQFLDATAAILAHKDKAIQKEKETLRDFLRAEVGHREEQSLLNEFIF